MLDELAAAPEAEVLARLGTARAECLARLLRQRTLRWAREAGGGLPPREAAHASEVPALLDGHDGPVVLVAPDVPRLSGYHRAAALDDLADGVLISCAPAADGRPFLVALARPQRELLQLATASFEELILAARRLGGDLGMLRPERRLASISDACAIAVDPLAPADLRDVVRTLMS